MITIERVREVLLYDPETGIFVWKVNRPNRFGRIGVRAGKVMKTGRCYIGLDGELMLASRLAFLWMTGAWPTQNIDHANLDCGDDRWSNLREVTQRENNANTRGWAKSGFKGVHRTRTGKWFATIRDGAIGPDGRAKQRSLGTYLTPEEAHEAYKAAALKAWGVYARTEHIDCMEIP